MADIKTITVNGVTYNIDDANAEQTANKVTSITSTSDDNHYPSAKAVWTLAGGKESSSNKVTSITSSSTDTQYPSAKAVHTLFNSIVNGNEVSY